MTIFTVDGPLCYCPFCPFKRDANMNTLIEAIQYDSHEWNLWRDLKVKYVNGYANRIYKILLFLLPVRQSCHYSKRQLTIKIYICPRNK